MQINTVELQEDGTFKGSTEVAEASFSSSLTFALTGKMATRLSGTQGGTTWTAGHGFMIRRDGTDTAWVMADARH